MSLFQELGKHLESVKSWNPQQVKTEEVFSYIDLSSVDKDKKAIVLNQIQQVMTANAPSRARQIVEKSDILVSTVRPNLNGVALVPGALNNATASTGYCVLRANEKTLNAKYLFY
jgi:type I restriction enzyme, S subunit